MKRLSVLRSTFITNPDLRADYHNLPSPRWYSIVLIPPGSLTMSAELSKRGCTREIILYAIAASSAGIAMATMTILWIWWLGEMLWN